MWNKRRIAGYSGALAVIALLLVASFTLGGFYSVNLGEQLNVNEPDDGLKGHIFVFVKRAGESAWSLWWSEHNVITNIGRNETCHLLGDDTYVNSNATTRAFKWIGIGTGSGGGATSTALTTPFGSRQIGTFTHVLDAIGNYTMSYTWTAGSFSGQTITEAGTFNAATGGVMLNYQDFTGITLGAGDSLQITFEFKIGS